MKDKKEKIIKSHLKATSGVLPTEWKEYLQVPGDLDDMLFGDLDSKSCSDR